MICWVLAQYQSPAGRRVIDDWRSSLSPVRRADFDVFLRNLVRQSKWEYPDIQALSGKSLKGLRELRWKSENVPHRVGGYFPTDDKFTMLIGWTHNAKKYDPSSALVELPKRMKKVKSGEASTCEYQIISGNAARR